MSEVSPSDIQKAANDGTKRLRNFRAQRLQFIKQYIGAHYDCESGKIGERPLGLVFNAISTLVPHMVFNFPDHVVDSKYLAYRDYAEMQSLALSQQDKQLKIKDVYRKAVVDAIFLMGIVKTGMCDSGTAIGFDEDDQIDPGTVYTENVDFDNFVIDPNCRSLESALFLGDKIRVSRTLLMDSGLYKNDLIERLPSAGSDGQSEKGVDKLSAREISLKETGELEDEVEVFELWVPRAKSIVTVPACEGYTADDFLRIHDAYCPDTGPYTFLRLTPPVPNNPIPVSMVGMWLDLAVMADRMAAKILQQAERQKDIIGYKRSAADDAQEALEAGDGEAIAMDDPDGVKTYSFGGQQPSNEAHIAQLQSWFGLMSKNTELAGNAPNPGSATLAQINQQNASIGLEDMKDLVYTFAAEEASKRRWFLHVDPLLEVPLIRRTHQPAQYVNGPMGPQMVAPPQQQEVQVLLTPEARCGDFLDFIGTVRPESMGRVDSNKKMLQAMEFATRVLPAAATAAQTCAMMGVAFSFPRFVVRMGKEQGLDWLEECFQDPEFQMQVQMMMARGPQEGQSKGQAPPNPGLGGMLQNGQPGQAGAPSPTPQQQFNASAQEGANQAQGALPVRQGY